ncbi:MAG: FAD/NAD(P)-binding protein [Myxococcota bacterium]
MSKTKRSKKVTVFGAGISGLTVAHELVERGFEVEVYEPRIDHRPTRALPYTGSKPDPRPDIGGMARTQWCRVPSGRFELNDGKVTLRGPGAIRMEDFAGEESTSRIAAILERPDSQHALQKALQWSLTPPERVAAEDLKLREIDEWNDDTPLPENITEKLAPIVEYLRQHFDTIADEIQSPLVEIVYVTGTAGQTDVERDSAFEAWSDAGWEAARAMYAISLMLDRGDAPYTVTWDSESLFPVAYLEGRPFAVFLPRELDPNEVDEPRPDRTTIGVSIDHTVVPGEHGYRFYPNFYAHLLETMRRIPIYRRRKATMQEYFNKWHDPNLPDAIPRAQTLEETGRTVADNLVSVGLTGIAARDGKKPIALKRVKSSSFRDLFTVLDALQGSMGLTMRDIVLMQLAMMRYMLSGPRRRTLLEDKTWAGYLGIPALEDKETPSKFSKAFRKAMRYWPRALIGLDAYEIDARTFGSITTQMLLDQLRSEFEGIDRTLNGPTTEGFLDPWREYLEVQGVQFKVGGCESLEFDDDGELVFKMTKDQDGEGDSRDGYVVLAVPPQAAQRAASHLLSTRGDTDTELNPTLEAVAGLLLPDAPEQHRQQQPLGPDEEGSPLRHFSGIQYYLAQEYSMIRGHTYLAESEWGLSLISQRQFWRRRFRSNEPIRGILSVVIGDWKTPAASGPAAGKSAWQCTAQEIAEQIWHQLKLGYPKSFDGPRQPPPPIAWHLDDEIHLDDDDKPIRNESPFLVNLEGHYAAWPGTPEAYEVVSDRLVFCGTYMKTFTRLNTMEAACESGRHASAAIIDHYEGGSAGTTEGSKPFVRNPEDHELPNVDLLKDLDDELCARGLPHMLDILQVDAAIESLFESQSVAQGDAKPSTLLTAVLASLASSSGLGTTGLQAMLDLLKTRLN